MNMTSSVKKSQKQKSDQARQSNRANLERCSKIHLTGKFGIIHIIDKDVRVQSLVSAEICYHKMYQDLLKQIDSMETTLANELEMSQIEMKHLVK